MLWAGRCSLSQLRLSLLLFSFVSFNIFAHEGAYNAVASLAVTVRVHGLAHLLVCFRIVQQGADFIDNQVMVGANEVDGAALEGFRALGGIAHHEHGFSKARSLFLDATAVGKDNGGFLHQIDELQILERLDEEEVGAREIFAEHLVDGLAHIGIEVHGIDEVHIGVFFAEVLHSRHHADEAFAEVLSSMAGNQDEFLSVVETSDVVAGLFQDGDLGIGKGLVALELFDHHVERVDDGVAGDEDPAMGLLLLQVLLTQGRRREVVGGDAPRDLPIHLLRPRAIDVVRAEAGLHVSHGDLLIEGGEGGCCRCRRVAMDQYYIGLDLFQHIPHPGKHPGRNVVQVLPLLHDVQVVIRLYFEYPQHLVQHLPMLPSHAHHRLELPRMLLELFHQGAHFDGFGAGAENE